MPIFGQVWLWSSLAFLLGAVLCWLLVARPARNRVGELEAQLTVRPRRQPAPERPEPPRYRAGDDSLVPGLGSRDDGDYGTRGYGLRDAPPPLPPERDRPAPYADAESHRDRPGSYADAEPTHDRPGPYGDSEPNRDFQSPRPLESEPFGFSNGLSAPPETDADLAEPPHAAATQYLDVSSGSLSAPPEVPPMSPSPSDRGWFDDELEGDAANQAPEEQAAVPRNRHHMVEPEQYEPFDARLVDDEDTGIHDAAEEPPRSAIEDDGGGTVFTQRTHPIPGELIRQIDEAGKEELARSESHQDDLAGSGYADPLADPYAAPYADDIGDQFADNLVDDLADDPAEPETDRRERTVESEAVAPPADTVTADEGVFTPPEELEPQEEAVFTPPQADDDEIPERSEAAAPPELPQEQTEVVAAVEEKPELPANDLPRRVPQANRITSSVPVRVEPTPTVSALPKRVPGKPRHQVPFGVMPGTTPEPVAAAPATAVDEPESQRSLFEPIIPAADEGTSTPPPPHRIRQGSGGGRGPFGPGSAMPLPGGASPSPEFTIKASVAALRYCTPESAQFGRTVAEVWFRTAADAERVGFRPVG